MAIQYVDIVTVNIVIMNALKTTDHYINLTPLNLRQKMLLNYNILMQDISIT